MAKPKLSTFERLQRWQKLSRSERKEIERRFQLEDPGWDIVNENVAGIDVSNESHFVAIDPKLDSRPVREFGSWTAALRETADWPKGLGIKRVVRRPQVRRKSWGAMCFNTALSQQVFRNALAQKSRSRLKRLREAAGFPLRPAHTLGSWSEQLN